jgi:hypothetical protein
MEREEFNTILKEVVGEWRGIESFDEEWRVGGITGGNCWDASPSYYSIAADEEPEFKNLDEFLERIAPNMSFIQYRLLMKKVEYRDWTYYDYYGNNTDYRKKCIMVDDIWTFLKERNII